MLKAAHQTAVSSCILSNRNIAMLTPVVLFSVLRAYCYD